MSPRDGLGLWQKQPMAYVKQELTTWVEPFYRKPLVVGATGLEYSVTIHLFRMISGELAAM